MVSELLFGIMSLVSIWIWTFLLVLPQELILPFEFKAFTVIMFSLEIALNFNTEKCDYNS